MCGSTKKQVHSSMMGRANRMKAVFALSAGVQFVIVSDIPSGDLAASCECIFAPSHIYLGRCRG